MSKKIKEVKVKEDVINVPYGEDIETGLKPITCKPGKESCVYMKKAIEGVTEVYIKAFELKCECSLRSDFKNETYSEGYCPVPAPYHLKRNMEWLNKMWLGDGCHTYDRDNIQAQLECGINLNNFVL